MTGNRLGTLSVGKLQQLLTPRDLLILRVVREHRFLTTKQIFQLHFWNHASAVSGIRACTRVLNRLQGLRLLHRLERPVGGRGGGSDSFVWAIDAAGDRLLRYQAGVDPAGRSRVHEPTVQFLAHTLAIADSRIQLEQMARSGQIELLGVATEPTTCRTFTTKSGVASIVKPDLWAITAIGEYEDHWAIEVDRASESIPTLLRKGHLYQRYHDTHREQDERGVFPLVLWLVPGETRRQRFHAALSADRQIDDRLHRIIAPEDFRAAIIGPVGPNQTTSMKGGTT